MSKYEHVWKVGRVTGQQLAMVKTDEYLALEGYELALRLAVVLTALPDDFGTFPPTFFNLHVLKLTYTKY